MIPKELMQMAGFCIITLFINDISTLVCLLCVFLFFAFIGHRKTFSRQPIQDKNKVKKCCKSLNRNNPFKNSNIVLLCIDMC